MDEEKFDISFFDTWEDGVGVRKMRSFFKSFVTNFADYSIRYHNKLGEFPFRYAERALTSAVLPSLIADQNNEPFVFMEHPFKNTGGNQRFLDFYVDYGDSLYLIEMKHRWNAYRTIDPDKKTFSRWNDCLDQIKDLHKKSIEDQLCEKMAYDNIFKIALLIMPVYQNQNREIDFEKEQYPSSEEYRNGIIKSFQENRDIKKKPNFYAVWKIKEDTNYHRDYGDGFTFYPYVVFAIYQDCISFE